MILVASQTVVANGNSRSTAVGLHGGSVAAEVLLNVTAAATAVGDTLNVYVQASVDGGTTWDDVISFTQVLGNGGAKKFLARWQGLIAPTTALAAPQDAALAAGSVAQGPHGLLWSAKWVVVSASGPSFTFSLAVTPMTARA